MKTKKKRIVINMLATFGSKYQEDFYMQAIKTFLDVLAKDCTYFHKNNYISISEFESKDL